MKIAQKLISNSNLINFRRNINPSSQAGSWGVPNAMAEHRCLPSPIPRQCLWRSPSLRSQIEMLSFYAQSHTHSWIAKSPKLIPISIMFASAKPPQEPPLIFSDTFVRSNLDCFLISWCSNSLLFY